MAATTSVNAGITILPVQDHMVRILTISEDGSATRTYTVTLRDTPVCTHENTEIRNSKAATCTENGYTGDTYCTDCGEQIASGEVIPAKGHTIVLQNEKAAACTEDGYTGDEICTVCGETVNTGTTIAATGHSWDSGVVTREATEKEEGIKTYTCTACRETRTETIPKLEEVINLKVPSVTLSAEQNNGKIKLRGKMTDFENRDDYYAITGQGFVYMTKAALGAKSLNVNTAGRTKVSIKSIGSTGTYSYSMTPKNTSTVYVIRAYLSYKNSSGKTVYSYSDPVYTSYDDLTK